MVYEITMKPPINHSTSIKSPNKKATTNSITKYFIINKPTSNQQCFKTTKLVNKIKCATKKAFHIHKKRISSPLH